MIRSTSSGLRPARSSACRAAASARSEVLQSSGAYQRLRMPVPASILSTKSGAEAAKRLRSASLLISFGGRQRPVEMMVA